MTPYRRAGPELRIDSPRDDGIVDDIVGQFSDPLAFYRELVQNAIDAGSPQIDVALDYDSPARTMRIAVRDRGEGMSRDILENQLLVLFRSTKERDDTKIGKFGIGFASVLGIRPSVVVVRTARDGERLSIHVYPDLTYELFDEGRSDRDGTTVTLHVDMQPEEVERFAHASRDALERWCRHATTEITLVARSADGGALIDARIDRPLGLDGALLEVQAQSTDGQTAAVVGVLPEGQPYGGFFNHGLMLYETSERLAGRLAFKVQDSRLGHTLSRDNVVRDDRFKAALRFVREVGENQLVDAAERALRETALADRPRHAALADGLIAADVMLARQRWWFPLLEPYRGEQAIQGSGSELWSGTRHSRLSAAVARTGRPIIHSLHVAQLRSSRVTERLRMWMRLSDIEQELTLVTPIELAPHEQVLIDEVAALLEAAYRSPSKLIAAELEGALVDELLVAGGPEDTPLSTGGDERAPWLLDRNRGRRNPLRMLLAPALVLNANHPRVAAARERARTDPHLAASLLARSLLLRRGVLSKRRSEVLLSRTLDRLVGGKR